MGVVHNITEANERKSEEGGGGEIRSFDHLARVRTPRETGISQKTGRSRSTCCAMRVGRSASASSVASSSEVSDAALHRNARTGRPGMWRSPRPERRALAGARARLAAARRFGRSMRDVACMSTGEIEPKGRRRAWGCGGGLGRHAFLFGGDVANSERSIIRYFFETGVPYEQPRFLRQVE